MQWEIFCNFSQFSLVALAIRLLIVKPKPKPFHNHIKISIKIIAKEKAGENIILIQVNSESFPQ